MRQHSTVGVLRVAGAMLAIALLVVPPADAENAASSRKRTAGERLEANMFEIGAFPNSSGNIDFKLLARVRYLERFSSGLEADYRTYTMTFEADEDSPIEGTKVSNETEVAADFVKAILPLTVAADFALSVEPGVHGKYISDDEETYGYRNNTDDTVSFFRYRVKTRQFLFGLFADLTSDVGSVFIADMRAAAYPFIAILSAGEKLYSQIDTPMEFDTQNYAMGFEANGELEVDINEILGASVGKLAIHAGLLRRFGEYSTQNVIALYNWKTTIATVAPLTRSVITAGSDIKLSFFRRWIDIIPTIGVIYERTIENYDGTVSDSAVWKAGLSASF